MCSPSSWMLQRFRYTDSWKRVTLSGLQTGRRLGTIWHAAWRCCCSRENTAEGSKSFLLSQQVKTGLAIDVCSVCRSQTSIINVSFPDLEPPLQLIWHLPPPFVWNQNKIKTKKRSYSFCLFKVLFENSLICDLTNLTVKKLPQMPLQLVLTTLDKASIISTCFFHKKNLLKLAISKSLQS